MAAPTFGAAGTYLAGSFTSGAAVAVPTGTAAGQVVLVFIYVESGNGTISGPAGFTQKASIDGTNHDLEIWWKRCTGTDSGTYAFTWSGNPWREAVAVRFSGCITTGDPFDVTSTNTGTGGTTPAVSATTTVADTLKVWAATNFNGGAWTPPSGWTERVDTGGGIGAATLAQAAAGATGSVTGSSAGGAAVSLAFLGALKPPASSGTNAPATVAPVSATGQPATATVAPATGGGGIATAGQAATSQVRPAGGGGTVPTSASAATGQVRPAPTSAPVGTAAPTPTAAVRTLAGSATVGVTASNATSTTSGNAPATVAPLSVTAAAPVPTVQAQAGAAAVGVAAAAAAATVAAPATSAPISTAGQDASTSTPSPAAELLEVYALAAADPHSITIHGVTGGRDVYLLVNCPATITTPSGWTDVTDRVATMASYAYQLPAANHSGGDIAVTLDLSVARPVAAAAIEAPPLDAGSTYAALGAPGNAPGSTAWGTGLHTFAARDTTLALFYFHQLSGGNPTFAVSSYDQGFTALADTGWAGAGSFGDEGVRIVVGYAPAVGFTADGVSVTLDAAGPSGSAVGFLAFDAAPAGSFGAGSAPVALAAGAAATQLNIPATSGPVAVAALAAVGAVAPQPGAGAVTLTGQPATTTVRANAGTAAVGTAGQGATVNTSSSTNANAGVAAVGVTASAAAASVRPAAASAPVGAAGLFDTGSEVLLQLVMDNPVGITVTASNATVSTSAGPTNANATSAPITVTTPTPLATVRAQAGVAAVAVAGRNPSVQVTGQTLAQAGVAAVGVAATGTSSTIRPAAGASSVITSAAGPLGQVGARPGGAVVLVAALLMLAQARGQAGTAPVAVAGRGPAMTGAGATWWVWRAGALVRHRALLDGVHPTTATIT